MTGLAGGGANSGLAWNPTTEADMEATFSKRLCLLTSTQHHQQPDPHWGKGSTLLFSNQKELLEVTKNTEIVGSIEKLTFT